jgi:hypothetical protein
MKVKIQPGEVFEMKWGPLWCRCEIVGVSPRRVDWRMIGVPERFRVAYIGALLGDCNSPADHESRGKFTRMLKKNHARPEPAKKRSTRKT